MGLFRLAAAAAIMLSALVWGAKADTFSFDYGNFGVSGQQITITRLPFVKANGAISYKDVIIRFRIENGKLAVVPGFPKTTASPSFVIGNFARGIYTQNSSSNQYQLDGPAAGPNGRGVWTLTGVGNALEMTFYAGPVDGHPLQERLNAAGITDAPATFGVSSNHGPLNSNFFGPNDLVAITNVNGDILLQSHTNTTGDHALPTTSITLRAP